MFSTSSEGDKNFCTNYNNLQKVDFLKYIKIMDEIDKSTNLVINTHKFFSASFTVKKEKRILIKTINLKTTKQQKQQEALGQTNET